jgi:hypothetical protein
MYMIAEQEASRLLAAAGAAHGVYETTELGGVYDQNWPVWYATWLLEHGLGELLMRPLTVPELADALAACDAAHRRERPAQSWPDYYAPRLIAQFTRRQSP